MTDIEPKTFHSISYSQASTWHNCPREWELKYINKLKSPSGIELVFGTSIHDTIQTWLTLLYGDDKKKAELFDMTGFFKERLIELIKKEIFDDPRIADTVTQDMVADYYADGCNILYHIRAYAKDWFPKNYTLIGVEVPLEVMILPHVKFRGFIDVVLYHKAAKIYYIYDFKTSKAGWFYQKKDPKKLDQLVLYKKFYSEQFGVPEDNIKVKFVILKRKLSDKFQFDTKHISGFEPASGKPTTKAATERLTSFIDATVTDDIELIPNQTPKPSESSCKFCYFNNDEKLCPDSFYLQKAKRAEIREQKKLDKENKTNDSSSL